MSWSGSLCPLASLLLLHILWIMIMQQLRSHIALCMHLRRYLLGHRLLLFCKYIQPSPGKALEGCVWLCCIISAATGCCLSQERINASSSSLLARTLPTMGSMNSAHSEMQWENWHCEQDQWYNREKWVPDKENNSSKDWEDRVLFPLTLYPVTKSVLKTWLFNVILSE